MSIDDLIREKEERIYYKLGEYFDYEEREIILAAMDLLSLYVEFSIYKSSNIIKERKIEISIEALVNSFKRDYYEKLTEIDSLFENYNTSRDFFNLLYTSIREEIMAYSMLFK